MFSFIYYEYLMILTVIYLFNLIFKISYNPFINVLTIRQFSFSLNLSFLNVKLIKLSWRQINLHYSIYKRSVNVEIDGMEIHLMTLMSSNNNKSSRKRNGSNNKDKERSSSKESTSNTGPSSSMLTFLLRWFSMVTLKLHDASLNIRSSQGEERLTLYCDIMECAYSEQSTSLKMESKGISMNLGCNDDHNSKNINEDNNIDSISSYDLLNIDYLSISKVEELNDKSFDPDELSTKVKAKLNNMSVITDFHSNYEYIRFIRHIVDDLCCSERDYFENIVKLKQFLSRTDDDMDRNSGGIYDNDYDDYLEPSLTASVPLASSECILEKNTHTDLDLFIDINKIDIKTCYLKEQDTHHLRAGSLDNTLQIIGFEKIKHTTNITYDGYDATTTMTLDVNDIMAFDKSIMVKPNGTPTSTVFENQFDGTNSSGDESFEDDKGNLQEINGEVEDQDGSSLSDQGTIGVNDRNIRNSGRFKKTSKGSNAIHASISITEHNADQVEGAVSPRTFPAPPSPSSSDNNSPYNTCHTGNNTSTDCSIPSITETRQVTAAICGLDIPLDLASILFYIHLSKEISAVHDKINSFNNASSKVGLSNGSVRVLGSDVCSTRLILWSGFDVTLPSVVFRMKLPFEQPPHSEMKPIFTLSVSDLSMTLATHRDNVASKIILNVKKVCCSSYSMMPSSTSSSLLTMEAKDLLIIENIRGHLATFENQEKHSMPSVNDMVNTDYTNVASTLLPSSNDGERMKDKAKERYNDPKGPPSAQAGRCHWIDWLVMRPSFVTTIEVDNISIHAGIPTVTLLSAIGEAITATDLGTGINWSSSNPSRNLCVFGSREKSNSNSLTPSSRFVVRIYHMDLIVTHYRALPVMDTPVVYKFDGISYTTMSIPGGVGLQQISVKIGRYKNISSDIVSESSLELESHVLLEDMDTMITTLPCGIIGPTTTLDHNGKRLRPFLCTIQTVVDVSIRKCHIMVDPTFVDSYRLILEKQTNQRAIARAWVKDALDIHTDAATAPTVDKGEARQESVKNQKLLTEIRHEQFDIWNEHYPTSDNSHVNNPHFSHAYEVPFTVHQYSIADIIVWLDHGDVRIAGIAAQELKVHNIYLSSVAGVVSQIGGCLEKVHIMDLTIDSTHHKFIGFPIPNPPGSEHIDSPWGNIGFHFSFDEVHSATLEVRILGVRLMYLQRFWIMLISYIRDYIMPAYFGTVFVPHPNDPWGIFRVAISFHDCEIHLPVNSVAREALVLMFRRFDAVKDSNNPQLFPMNYLEADWINKKQWHCLDKIVHETLYGRNAIDNWKLDRLRKSLVSPCPTPPPVCEYDRILYDLHAYDITLCTWCSHVRCTTGVNLHGRFELAAAEGNIPVGEIMNTVSVPVTWLDEADIVLTLGQYMTIVYMIQQNFSEEDEILPKTWDPDFEFLEVDDLSEDLYRKEAVDSNIPMLSTVPIKVGAGRILAVSDLIDYKQNLYSNIHDEEDAGLHPFKHDLVLLLRKGGVAADGSRVYTIYDLVDSVPNRAHIHHHRIGLFNCQWMDTEASHSKNRLDHPECYSPLNLHHNDDHNDGHDHDGYGHELFSLNFHDLNVRFDRKHLYGGGVMAVEIGLFEIADASKAGDDADIGINMSAMFELQNRQNTYNVQDKVIHEDTAIGPLADRDEDKNKDRPIEYQFRYRQEDCGNLRRCLAWINDSAIVLQLPVFNAALAFTVDPINLLSQRYLNVLNEIPGAVDLDFKRALDVEVELKGCTICAPTITRDDGTYAVCIETDVTYEHVWRGFLQSGPGSVAYDIELTAYAAYISQLHNLTRPLREYSARSIFDPFKAVYHGGFRVVPPLHQLEKHLKAIGDSIKFSDKFLEKKIMKEQMKREDRVANAAILVHDTTETRDAVQDEDLEDNHLGVNDPKFHNEDKERVGSTLHCRMSIQDFLFFASVVEYMQNLANSVDQEHTIYDEFEEWLTELQDIRHLAPLTDFHRHVPLTTNKDFKVWRANETLFKVCPLVITLRNNTYNLEIAQCRINDAQITFSRLNDACNFTSPICANLWSMNDTLGKYEPVVENLEVTAIALVDDASLAISDSVEVTDEVIENKDKPNDQVEGEKGTTDSIPRASSVDSDLADNQQLVKSSNFHKNGGVIRFNVYSFPINVCITHAMLASVMKKITLADVVTTSSVDIPPYRIQNELGLNVTCTFRIEGQVDKGNALTIETGETVPVNLHRKNKNKGATSLELHLHEHAISISFKLDSCICRSRKALPMDREGVYLFDMERLLLSGGLDMDRSPPFVAAYMCVRPDGGRELKLRSIFSFKNLTRQSLKFRFIAGDNSDRNSEFRASDACNSVESYGSILNYVERLLEPEEEWFMPINLTNDDTKVQARINGNLPWVDALPQLSASVFRGRLGFPARLSAAFFSCEAPDGTGSRWSALLKPHLTRSSRHGNGSRNYSSNRSNKSKVKVVYPQIERRGFIEEDIPENMDEALPVNSVEGIRDTFVNTAAVKESGGILDDIMDMASDFKLGHLRSSNAEPMQLQICAPIVVRSELCQPFIYRLAILAGSAPMIIEEGTLLPSHSAHIHDSTQIGTASIYICVRVRNYRWSDWCRVMNSKDPYREKRQLEIHLRSMHLRFRSQSLELPALVLQATIRDNEIRIWCPLSISNRTSLTLNMCETSGSRHFIPSASRESISMLLRRLMKEKGTNQHPVTFTSLRAVKDDVKRRKQEQSSLQQILIDVETGTRLRVVKELYEADNDSFDHFLRSSNTSFDEYGHERNKEKEGLSHSPIKADRRRSWMKLPDLYGTNTNVDTDMEALIAEINRTASEDNRERQRLRSWDVVTTDDFDLSLKSKEIHNNTRGASRRGLSPTPSRESLSASAMYSIDEDKDLTLASLCRVIVHAPMNHTRLLEVRALSSWNLLDLMTALLQRFDSENSQDHSTSTREPLKLNEFVFFSWPDGGDDLNSNKYRHVSSCSPKSSTNMFTSRENTNRRPCVGAQKSPGAGAVLPVEVQTGMLTPCSANPLPSGTLVDSLPKNDQGERRLVLMHCLEWHTYLQVGKLEETGKVNAGTMNRMLGREKAIWRTHFDPFDGDIPFNPPRLGTSITGRHAPFGLRVQDSVEWSDNVDLSNFFSLGGQSSTQSLSLVSRIDAPGDGVQASKSGTNSIFHSVGLTGGTNVRRFNYDVGLHVEKGAAKLLGQAVVTLVPRFILISRLPFSLWIRQSSVGAAEALDPGMVQPFHFMVPISDNHDRRHRAFQVSSRVDDDDVVPSTGPAWSCDIHLGVIGTSYVKLRNPFRIIRVHVDLLGPSFVVTISEQAERWPPYRIDNVTSMRVRYRQSSINESTSQSSSAHAIRQWEWDYLQPRRSSPYAWETSSDHNTNSTSNSKLGLETSVGSSATSANHNVLRVEFEQGGQWIGFDVALDILHQCRPISLRKELPEESAVLFEGVLTASHGTLNINGVGVASGGKRGKAQKNYAVLRSDGLYFFSNNGKNSNDGKSHGHGHGQSTVNAIRERSLLEVFPLSSSLNESIQMARVVVLDGDSAAERGNRVHSERRAAGLVNQYGIASFATGLLGVRNEKDQNTFDINSSTINSRRNIKDLDLCALRRILVRVAGHAGLFGSGGLQIAIQNVSSTDELFDILRGKSLTSAELIAGMMDLGYIVDEKTVLDLVHRLEVERLIVRSDSGDDSKSAKRYSSVMLSRQSTLSSVSANSTNDHSVLTPSSANEGTRYNDDTEDTQFSWRPISQRSEISQITTGSDSQSSFSMSNNTNRPRLASSRHTPRSSKTMSHHIHYTINARSLEIPRNMDEEYYYNDDNALVSERSSSHANTIYSHNANKSYGLGLLLTLGDQTVTLRFRSSLTRGMWMNAIYAALEDSWFEQIKGRGSHRSGRRAMLESFEAVVMPKVECDGPTKVLSLVESGFVVQGQDKMEEKTNNKKANSAKKDEEDGRDSSNRDYSLVGHPGQQRLESIIDDRHNINSTLLDADDDDEDILTHNDSHSSAVTPDLFVSIVAQSVGVSIVDPTPCEIMYISFDEIHILLERRRQTLAMALTVREAQTDNQLPGAPYPVAIRQRLHALTSGKNKNADGSGLTLRGLGNVGLETLPAFHLYFQQQLPQGLTHKTRKEQNARNYSGPHNANLNPNPQSNIQNSMAISDVNAIKGTSTQDINKTNTNVNAGYTLDDDDDDIAERRRAKSELVFFDHFSIWIAPIDVNCDSEILIRALRVADALIPKHSDGTKEAVGSVDAIIRPHLSKFSKRQAVDEDFSRLCTEALRCYKDMVDSEAAITHEIYFSVLHLHPMEIMLTYQSSPDFQAEADEESVLYKVAQIDAATVQLNTLYVNNAHGTPDFIADAVLKHYKSKLLRQVHKLLGSTDIIEGSIGLVGNLGTGVYDFFYEPIEGLMDTNKSFLTGLGKGGKSLGSKTIGGTAGFTSKALGALGRGASLLTLDSKYQKNRARGKMKKVGTMSQGVYVGAQEFSSNIMQGIAGIVRSPYEGWKEDGASGMASGFAKGLLGVALKPAVGAFDLASRAAEGIRNATLNSRGKTGGPVTRRRLPRVFGRGGLLTIYNIETSSLQATLDQILGWNPLTITTSGNNTDSRFKLIEFHKFITNSDVFGLHNGYKYIIALSETHFLLLRRNKERKASHDMGDKTVPEKDFVDDALNNMQLVWSAPGSAVDSLYFEDNHLNILLHEAITSPISNGMSSSDTNSWSSNHVVAHCKNFRSWITLQKMTEKAMVPSYHAKYTPSDENVNSSPSLNNTNSMDSSLNEPQGSNNSVIYDSAKTGFTLRPPIELGLSARLFKKAPSTLRAIVASPTEHLFRLVGQILYEFSLNDSLSRGRTKSKEGKDKLSMKAAMRRALGKADDKGEYVSTVRSHDGELKHLYLISNVHIYGPAIEVIGNESKYTVHIEPGSSDSTSLYAMKLEEDLGIFVEYKKSSLILIFNDEDLAQKWATTLRMAASEAIEHSKRTSQRTKRACDLMSHRLVIPFENSNDSHSLLMNIGICAGIE